MADHRDTGLTLDPKFDDNGLLTAVCTDRASGAVLMVAHMDAEALAAKIATGEAHFWSRSRKALWQKGETSGTVLDVKDIRIDRDKDEVWLLVEHARPACPTGHRSCLYGRVGWHRRGPCPGGRWGGRA